MEYEKHGLADVIFVYKDFHHWEIVLLFGSVNIWVALSEWIC